MGKIEVSQARIEANRRNCKKSTGPKTPEGKLKSRRNSLIHGLAGRGSVMPEVEAEAVQGRYAMFHKQLRARDDFDAEMVHIVATESVRLERIRVEERAVRDQLSRHAEACWDDERRAEVEALARKLRKNPAEIARRLAMTSHGCDWLIERWEMLAEKVKDGDGWGKADLRLVHDLLGIAQELRRKKKDPNAPQGQALAEHRTAIAEEEIERLKIRKYERLDDLDAERRDCMIHGYDITGHPALARFRRYENMSVRRLEWALRQLQTRVRLAEHSSRLKDGDGENRYKNFNIMRGDGQSQHDHGHGYRADAGPVDATAGRQPRRRPGEAATSPEVPSVFATPSSLSTSLEYLFPLTVEAAERRLFGPLADRFTMSDKAAAREKKTRKRLVRRARELEQRPQH